MNYFGPTIFNQAGGKKLSHICLGWAQLLSQGPETLVLPDGLYAFSENGTPKAHYFKTNRNALVKRLETLADWGEQAATAEFFILHLGI